MINKDNLIILNLLFDILIQDYGFTIEELLNDKQKANMALAIEKRIGKITVENEKEVFKSLFDKYLKKLK